MPVLPVHRTLLERHRCLRLSYNRRSSSRCCLCIGHCWSGIGACACRITAGRVAAVATVAACRHWLRVATVATTTTESRIELRARDGAIVIPVELIEETHGCHRYFGSAVQEGSARQKN